MELFRSAEIPFRVDLSSLMKRLRVKAGTPDSVELERLVTDAQAIGRPRFVFGITFPEAKGDDYVQIETMRFTSRVLRKNLDHAERVFPFVCTCGLELEEWGRKVDDMLTGYWVEAIKEDALRLALNAFFEQLNQRFRPGHVSTMSPGSLEDWPISEQIPLFRLLGDPQEVSLTESLLMVPTKSVSGIVFPTDSSFESCQLCPRSNCPNRRAPYDESLYEREYCPAVK